MKKFTTCAFLLFTAPAYAVDFNQTIKTFAGKEFTDEKGKPSPQVLGDIVEGSLLSVTANDPESSKRYWLAVKIAGQRNNPELTPEDIVLIKKALSVQPLAIWGQATRMIDPTFKPQ